MCLLRAVIDRAVGFMAVNLLDVLGPGALAVVEETTEVFEPDELWEAMRRHAMARHPAGKHIPDFVPAHWLE